MFYIGQIFKSSYPLEAAEFCMNNGAKIVEKPERFKLSKLKPI